MMNSWTFRSARSRILWFLPSEWGLPGMLTVSLRGGGSDRHLVSRNLSSREILDLRISSGSGAGGDLSVEVDTSKTWISEDIDLQDPGYSPGSDREHALTVMQAISSAGMAGVWVKGYIVGGDLTSSGTALNTGPSFQKNTHFAIASRSSVSDKSSCLSVELKKGAIRDQLNGMGIILEDTKEGVKWKRA